MDSLGCRTLIYNVQCLVFYRDYIDGSIELEAIKRWTGRKRETGNNNNGPFFKDSMSAAVLSREFILTFIVIQNEWSSFLITEPLLFDDVMDNIFAYAYKILLVIMNYGYLVILTKDKTIFFNHYMMIVFHNRTTMNSFIKFLNKIIVLLVDGQINGIYSFLIHVNDNVKYLLYKLIYNITGLKDAYKKKKKNKFDNNMQWNLNYLRIL